MSLQSQVIVNRVRLVFILIALFSLGLIYRLYSIQILAGEEYSLKADRQYVTTSPALVDRGSIFFTTKEGEQVTAAYQQTGNIVVINPSIISDPEAVYERINSVIPIDKEEFMKKAAKKSDPYEEILKKVDAVDAQKIVEPTIPGLQIYKQKWRSYPSGKLASNALGFMAYGKGDVLSGQYGLEYKYEDTLKRTNESTYTNFFVEIFSNIKKTFSEKTNWEGDVVTTIEPNVQGFLDTALESVNKQWSSEYTGGIIMDPTTGEIVAMSNYPTFDPNNFGAEKDAKIYSNKLVEDVYEMGSIIKPLTVAAGIDAGVITAKSTYNDKGFLVLNGKKISNYDGVGRGVIDIQQVLNQSLNTGVAYVVTQLGKDKFSQYMKNYGLDKKTGIDLPFEAAPLVANLNSPRDIEHATASYGQGIAMTPVATIRALAVLANGGKLINPHVVKKIDYRTGLFTTTPTDQFTQIIKPETSAEITRMLVRVVDEALRGGTVKLEHYSVAAKTGTAQISEGGGNGYYADRYLHSFFGYFPAYKPKFIIFLYTYYPKHVSYASETLTETFINLTKYLINYYDIPPDR